MGHRCAAPARTRSAIGSFRTEYARQPVFGEEIPSRQGRKHTMNAAHATAAAQAGSSRACGWDGRQDPATVGRRPTIPFLLASRPRRMADHSASYLQSVFGLFGKTAVAIGGTGTLGGAFCDALAGAGAHVIVVGRKAEQGAAAVERIREAHGSAEFFAADSTQRGDLERLVSHLQQSRRACDILINGAGVNAATPFLQITDEEWDRIIDTNLRSVRLACQVFGQFMLEQQTRGAIINIASLSGITPLSRVFTYAATKAAVLNLTQNLAREWAQQGIRVNALSPGFFP